MNYSSGTTIIFRLTAATANWSRAFRYVRHAPVFGWYRYFETRPTFAQRVRSVHCSWPRARPQARSCAGDRARWKRRRFVQALRRKTA